MKARSDVFNYLSLNFDIKLRTVWGVRRFIYQELEGIRWEFSEEELGWYLGIYVNATTSYPWECMLNILKIVKEVRDTKDKAGKQENN